MTSNISVGVIFYNIKVSVFYLVKIGYHFITSRKIFAGANGKRRDSLAHGPFKNNFDNNFDVKRLSQLSKSKYFIVNMY